MELSSFHQIATFREYVLYTLLASLQVSINDSYFPTSGHKYTGTHHTWMVGVQDSKPLTLLGLQLCWKSIKIVTCMDAYSVYSTNAGMGYEAFNPKAIY